MLRFTANSIGGSRAKEVYERLAVKDIQDAADVLRPVYDRTKKLDGYVSREVSPDVANDTEGTLAEARHLWKAVARPNVMIKVPATPAGLPAIRTLITEWINVNVTLLFAPEAYEAVAHPFVDLFRERLLARLTLRHASSEELARKLLTWRHPGLSAHVGEAIPFEDESAIEDVACYVVRNPLSLKKLVYLDGQKAVLYRSRMNPSLGRNFEAMDPLEWLARLADHSAPRRRGREVDRPN